MKKEYFSISILYCNSVRFACQVTIDPEFGGSGMDATAACIVHEEISAQVWCVVP